MTTNAISADDTILGYALKERIGAGSYGEVWDAVAPGGIRKAVKLIYGFHDENRAQNELKSVDRIKAVRHPFLLSLERIDIVDGRLVIITELADMSLKDRFRECCDNGERGIPRDELIGYLRDAADALDHLSDAHSLQHLDIKPENLLLLGGHVKVADFGLVKEVQDATQSLMGGLTPAYAPPELFDGRPNKASDQYSLAILFAEMLTGIRPFPGTTAAQLAVQHMQGRPNLKGLSPGDQNVVSKALSKSPELRYPCCRTFVEDLTTRQSRSKPQQRRRLNPAIKSDENSSTVVVQQDPGGDGTIALTTSTLFAKRAPATVTKLDRIDCDVSKASVQPTLFLGIGSTATQILRLVQARMTTRLGGRASTPAVQFLCLDTDQRALIESTEDLADDALNFDDILAMPLRKPEEYRDDANMHLSWLSRRWIYNIPRSLQTEGIRPLGRLAFVDNSGAFFKRLQDKLSQVTAPEALAATAETTELLPVETPRIFVLSSIAGGVGSGCVIDVAYSVRVALAELGMQDDNVYGVLLHSTARFDRDPQLAIANAYTCLGELKHYEIFGYPGDDSCGLPAFDASDGPFSHTYLVDLGDNLFEDDYEQAIDEVAEYLYQNSLSPASLFFDACREKQGDDEATVRTFGVSNTRLSRDDQVARITRDLTKLVVESWTADDPSSQHIDVDQFVNQAVTQLGLTEQRLVERFNEIVAVELGGDPKSHLLTVVQQALNEATPDPDKPHAESKWDTAQTALDRSIGPRPIASEADELRSTRVQIVLGQAVTQLGERLGTSFANSITCLIDHAEARYGGAQLVQEQSAARLAEVAESLVCFRQRCADKLDNFERHAEPSRERKSRSNQDVDGLESQLPGIIELRLHEIVVAAAQRLAKQIQAHLRRSEELLLSVRQELRTVLDKLEMPETYPTSSPKSGDVDETQASGPTDNLVAILAENLQKRLPTFVAQVNQHLQHGFLAESGGLLKVSFDEESRFASRLPTALLAASRAAVANAMKETQIEQVLRDANVPPAATTRWLQEQVEAAKPRLLVHGGATRMLVGLPERARSNGVGEFIQQQSEEKPTIAACTCGDLLVCYEAEQVPLVNIAFALLEEQPHCANYVNRLRSRIDVDWSQLTELT